MLIINEHHITIPIAKYNGYAEYKILLYFVYNYIYIYTLKLCNQ